MWGALDPVAGPYAQTVSGMIRDGGQYVLYSRLGGMTANVGISDLLYRGVTVRCYPMCSLSRHGLRFQRLRGTAALAQDSRRIAVSPRCAYVADALPYS